MDKSSMRVFICDDDEINLAVNKSMVESLGKKYKQEVKTYTCIGLTKEAINRIKTKQVDIAVLDVELPKNNGIAIAKMILKYNPEVPIIFVTNFEQYKSTAWDLMAVGFVKKPAHIDKFEFLFTRAITLAKEMLNKENSQFIRVIIDKKAVKLRVEKIISAEKVLRKVEFKTNKAVYTANGTLREYERYLPDNFLKVNQSTLVNKKDIDYIDSKNVYLSNGDEIVIGTTYKESVREFARTLDNKKEQSEM